jgi:hypothetical protein
MSEYRVLVMDSMSDSPSDVEAAKSAIINGLKTAAPHINVICVLGTEEKDRSFKDHGSWDAWCTHLATGINYQERTPLFNAIAVMSEFVGKATGSIMEQALDARRMGLLVEKRCLRRITHVEVTDSEDWKSGWRVRCNGS